MNGYGRSVTERLVATAAAVLFVAVALTLAVRLIEAIWTILVAIGMVGMLAGLAFAVYRARTRGW
jgi:hypothetical protein